MILDGTAGSKGSRFFRQEFERSRASFNKATTSRKARKTPFLLPSAIRAFFEVLMFDETETPEALIQAIDLPAGMTLAAIDNEGRCIETAQLDFEGSVEDFMAGLQDVISFVEKHQRFCTFQARGEG